VTVRRIGFGGGDRRLIRGFRDRPSQPEACPAAIIETDTNAQHPFHDDFLLLDAIFCSIDGSTQES
jgi:hypothetical protein